MRRSRRLVVWLALVALMVAGCARVPTSGPVESAGGQRRPAEVTLEVAPDSPQQGASPRTVVEGFLQAMANYQQGYAVARLYLASDVRDSWRPENGVTVYEDGYGVTSTPESAKLEAPLRGRVGSNGAFHHASESLSHDFDMVRDGDGEWRIHNPPDGLLLSAYLFENFYRALNVYFYEPNWTALVPDPIFVPTRNQSATALLQGLLRGPSDWLQPVVVTALPAQTRLNVEGAPIDDQGVVNLSLTDSVAGLADEQRSRMAGQIIWTLRQLEGVQGVRFLLNAAPYAIPEAVDGVVRIDAFSWMETNPVDRTVQVFGATDEGVVSVNDAVGGTELQPVPGPLAHMPGIESMAGAPTGERVAVVTNGRTSLRTGSLSDAAPVELVRGAGILRPQFVQSRELELWTIRDEGSAQVADRIVGNDPHDVALPAFAGTRVLAFRISADGTRIAAVRRTPMGRTELGVARINRSLPEVVIDGWRPIPLGDANDPGPEEIVDVGWIEPTSLIVLAGRTDRQPVKPYRVDISAAAVTEIGQPDNWQARSVASLPRTQRSRALVVGANGTWRYEGDYRWPLVTRRLIVVAYAA